MSPIIQDGASFRLFKGSIRAEDSEKAYTTGLLQFAEYNKIKKIDDLLSLDVKVITNYIIDFLLNMKKRKLKSSTRRVRLAALRHFTTMNDIILNWKKIYKINREAERPKKNCIKEYSYDDIKKMLSVSDLCDQTMIYLMSSSGVRIGAIPELKYGDLTKIEIADKVSRVDDSSDNEYIYMVKAYAGYSEEYLTFTTAETARAIDGYRQYRERFGEKIKVNTPLFIHKFDANDKTHDANQLPKNTIRTRLRRILLESGVAEHQRLERDKNNKVIGNGTIRHDVAASHGLRKFFDTTCMDAGVEYIFIELMMGHDVKLQESYYSKESKESQKKILIEYMKAINALTINEEARLKLKNTELAKKNKDNEEIIQQRLQAMKIRYEQGMKVMREEMENKFQQILTKIDTARLQ